MRGKKNNKANHLPADNSHNSSLIQLTLLKYAITVILKLIASAAVKGQSSDNRYRRHPSYPRAIQFSI